MSRIAPLVAGTTLVAVIACTPAPAPRQVAWRVLDSAWAPPWDPMNDSNVVYRITVQRGAVADTVDDVLGPLPVVIGDSAVAGIRFVRADSARQVFFLTLPARSRIAFPLPRDIQFQFTDVTISPSGHYVA